MDNRNQTHIHQRKNYIFNKLESAVEEEAANS